MLYEYKTIKGYRELTADAKTPQQLQAAKQKYAEYKKQCMKEFAADWTDAQQTTFISKIMQGRPDYVNQVNNAEDGTN